MADYTVISDVGASLIKLLREQMTPEPVRQPELIGLASPADKGDLALSVFLYSIKENGESRQTHMIKRGSDAIQFPPMTVDLHYLITAHSTAELQVRGLDEHRILGRAMQILYDNSILRGSLLQGSLAERNEEVRIVMESIPAESLTRMWNFADNPYRLSLSYIVGPVNIDSNRIKTAKPVLERDIRIQG